MKLERFKYHEKFCVKSTFLDTAIDVEGVLDEGETLLEGVEKARAEMLKVIGQRTLENLDLGWGKGVPPPSEIKQPALTPKEIIAKFQSTPIINKSIERLEIQIDNANTLEELDKILLSYDKLPSEIMEQIENKKKKLANG